MLEIIPLYIRDLYGEYSFQLDDKVYSLVQK